MDYGIANQFRYLSDRLGYPVYRDTDICFYPTAEEAFAAQLEALKKAERFIFMEYHAIEEKSAFERLFEVLSARAAAGVEVRLFLTTSAASGSSTTILSGAWRRPVFIRESLIR